MGRVCERISMEPIGPEDGLALCASCHKPIRKAGVCIGEPSFTAPAVNVCGRCILIAVSLTGGLICTREGIA